ncbi:hypothetical protein ABK040_001935 [Willaertia magna]
MNQIKNYKREVEIKQRVKLTIKEIKSLLLLFEKGNKEFMSTVIEQNNQNNKYIALKRKQTILGLKLKWKAYLTTLKLDQLSITCQNIEYCF